MDRNAAEAAYWDLIIKGIPCSLDALRTLFAILRAEFDAGSEPKLLNRPEMDDAALRRTELERLRQMASHAANETVYYADVFRQIGLDPARLEWEDLARLPITPKVDLRDRGGDFVAADATPAYCSFTGGTTGGKPTAIWWSDREFEMAALIQCIQGITGGNVDDDIRFQTGDSTQFLSMTVNSRAGALFGDSTIWGRIHSADATLDQLMETHRIGKRRMRPSTFVGFASYFGAMVEAGRRRGAKPDDFGLRFMVLGGEVVTGGLVRRSKEVFGDKMIVDVYGSSELWGSGGAFGCRHGHFHFGHGAIFEFLDVDTLAPAAPGSVATLVATCLPPSRETTLLLRYDTEDLFQMLDEPASCEWGPTQVSKVMGKRPLSLRHPDGHWTFPRQVLEGLEDADDVPLPARCGYWAAGDEVVVEVVAPGLGAAGRARIGDSLERQGVRLSALVVRQARDELERPYPVRCDGR